MRKGLPLRQNRVSEPGWCFGPERYRLVMKSSVLLRRDDESILRFFSIALSFTLAELQPVFDKRVSVTMTIWRPRWLIGQSTEQGVE